MAGMATKHRLSSYKCASKIFNSIKVSNRISVTDRQDRSRDDVITRKRLKLITAVDYISDRHKQSKGKENLLVINAIKCLKKGDKLQALNELHRLFASCESNADEFLKHEGLQPLHSCFKSYNVEILYASAWCVINLTAAASSSFSSALLGLAPTLMQFLKGSNVDMQELCAWGLANLAGDDPSNADVLHKQGCTDALIDLLELCHSENEERAKSVLFALINLGRSNTCCLRCMHNKQIYKDLQGILKRTPVDSALNFEIGWLLCCIYPGYGEKSVLTNHLPMVTRLVSDRLVHICEGLDPPFRVCFPFVRCLRNLIGLNPSMAIVMLDDPRTSKTFCDLLASAPDSLKQETLGLINNCMVDVCSRTLLTLQPNFLPVIISQCHGNAKDLTIQALLVIQAMARTSAHVDSYLLQCGILSTLTQVIVNVTNESDIGSNEGVEDLISREASSPLKVATGILLDLALSQPDLIKLTLDKEDPLRKATTQSILTRLASLGVQRVDAELAHQTTQILYQLGLT